jgi:hypothetical protein
LIRSLVRGELGVPGFEPALPQASDFLGWLSASRPLAKTVPDSFEKLHQHQLGIAQDRNIDGIGLVEVARIVGRMDNLLAGRDRRAGDAMRREATADAEHDVGGVQEMPAVTRVDDATSAE